MVKIAIIEDSLQDLVYRYGSLRKMGHNIEVRTLDYLTQEVEFDDFKHIIAVKDHSGRVIPEEIEKFDTTKIKPYSPDEKLVADLYFVDGLNGQWESVVKGIPIEKVIINSGESFITSRAEEAGYRILKGDDASSLVGKMLTE